MEREELHIIEKLTPRQVEVFTLVGEGKTSGEIALELGIEVKTVQNHRDAIAHTLDLEGNGALYHLAVKIKYNGGGSLLALALPAMYAQRFYHIATNWVQFRYFLGRSTYWKSGRWF